MSHRTPQDVYASNLLRVQNFGYPLRNPKPEDRFDPEGFRIGDVGYVDDYGKFNKVFNISSLPKELLEDGIQSLPLDQPVGEEAFDTGKIFRAGVKQLLEEPRPGAEYAFTMTSNEGAILILPDGASRFELADEQQLGKIREHVMRYALQWCRFAKKDTLYLITAVFRSKSWTLASFHNGSHGDKILVHRRACDSFGCDRIGSSRYHWECESNVDNPVPPRNNAYLNQTVLLKGFKMTARWDWLPIVERAEKTEWWFICFLASLWSAILRGWLSRIAVDYVPFRNLCQPHHPLDTINRVLLEKNPRAQLAVTHDNDWIQMLERGLSYTDLIQEDHLLEFMLKEHMWDTGSNHRAVYLRNIDSEDANGEREVAPEYPSRLRSDDSRLSIIHMRLEGVDIDHIYVGVCVLVQIGSTTRRTKNKPHADIIEWDDEITLPSDLPVTITICCVFQLGSTMGIREISSKQAFNTEDMSGGIHVMRFSVGKGESDSSLLITVARHVSPFDIPPSHEEKSEFVEKTNFGFQDFYAYYDDPKEEHLERAVAFFRCALEKCGRDPTCRTTALFNLATSKFIWCQACGARSELYAPIKLYGDALKMQGCDHPDRPATLLLLAQVLLFRLGQEYNEAITTQIRHLLVEIPPDGSRERRTADTIVRTCRFYQAINAEDPIEVGSVRDLDHGAYVPPYGYYDRPRLLHKLGVASWIRFQLYADLGDLEKSIILNQDALRLIPDGYYGQESIAAGLGRALLKRLEILGNLADVDTSVDLVKLGERIVMALDNMSYGSSSEELRAQIALVSAAETALRHIVQDIASPHITEVQSLIDEWTDKDGIPTRCKRELGMLLSFLGGEGETKMCKLLAKVIWPFKEYKVAETTEVLRKYMPYFQVAFATQLGIALASTVLLTWGSVEDVLITVTTLKLPKFHILRAICDVLEQDGRVTEAIVCFRRMKSDLTGETSFHDERQRWEVDFQQRCRTTFEKRGDIEMHTNNHSEAAGHFSTTLSLNPPDRVDILIKRGRARVSMERWDEALSDANEVIKLKPLSPLGYEMRDAVLQSMPPERPVASKAMLEANARRRRHPAPFECAECKKTFTAIFSFKRHMQEHTGERPYQCSIPGCSQRFYNSSDCKRHEKSKKRHKDLLIPESIAPVDRSPSA